MEHTVAVIFLSVSYVSVPRWFIPLIHTLEVNLNDKIFSPTANRTPLNGETSSFNVSSYTLFLLYGLLPMVLFYLYGAILGYVDLSTSSRMVEWRDKYKVQYKVRITPLDYIQGITISLRNWLFVGLPWAYFLCYYLLPTIVQSRTFSSESSSVRFPSLLPSPLSFLYQFSNFLIWEEILFYFSHRLFHTVPYLFRNIHMFHHTYSAPFGIAAIYAHPLEHLVSNVVPVSAGSVWLMLIHIHYLPSSYLYLLDGHIAITTIWIMAAILSTMTSHSGYCIPGMETPYFHDWHHENGKENFGVLQILDAVFGTDKLFRKFEKDGKIRVPRDQEQRNKMKHEGDHHNHKH